MSGGPGRCEDQEVPSLAHELIALVGSRSPLLHTSRKRASDLELGGGRVEAVFGRKSPRLCGFRELIAFPHAMGVFLDSGATLADRLQQNVDFPGHRCAPQPPLAAGRKISIGTDAPRSTL